MSSNYAPESTEERALRTRANLLGLDAGRSRNGLGALTGGWGVVARQRRAIVRWFTSAEAAHTFLDAVARGDVRA